MENNNIEHRIESVKPKLKEDYLQLSDTNKKNFGFDLSESVINVEQCGYAISEEDTLYTYGIEPCCALVLFDENKRVLFHLDGSVTPKDVIEITDNIGLLPNATAFFIPGASCGIPGSFEYKKLEEEYRKAGYSILEERIPATFGFVTVEHDRIIIGTSVDRSLDKNFAIEDKRGKIETQKLGKETIDEIIDIASLEKIEAEISCEEKNKLISNNEQDK